VDGCSVNTKAHRQIEKDQGVNWMLLLCLSHMANNAGKETEFVLVEKFWKLLQKVFAHSENAKSIFAEVMGESWTSFSDTRWYSKYEIIASLAPKWSSLPGLFTSLIKADAAAGNAGKLLAMVQHPSESKLLAIELASLVEGLEPLVKFCYTLEGDGELAFEAGEIIDGMYDIYREKGLPDMPSVNRLVSDAVNFI